jgi:hypothetical protein
VANIDASSASRNLKTFEALCQSRALRWQCDEFDLDEAVDGCLAYAAQLKLSDLDEVQFIIARAFAAVRDDLGGWRHGV